MESTKKWPAQVSRDMGRMGGDGVGYRKRGRIRKRVKEVLLPLSRKLEEQTASLNTTEMNNDSFRAQVEDQKVKEDSWFLVEDSASLSFSFHLEYSKQG